MTVGELFVKLALDSKQYEKDLGKMEGVTRQKALTLGSIFKNAFSFALGIGLVQGFRNLGGAITDFVNTAARTDVLNIAMQSVARSSGYMLSAVQADKKAVMELGIAEQEATQILNRFMQAQLDTADAAKLSRVAQDAAVIAGYNSSQAAEQMTEAIAKQRPELLSAFGMTRNMLEIYNDYAKTVGKTTNQLSEAEKKQAMLNYILKEGEKIAGTYEASMGAVGKQIGSLPRYWDTLKNAIAKPLALPALSVIVDGITNSLKNAISWAEINKATLQRWGQTAANAATLAIRGFRYVTKAVVENWAIIKIAGTALLTYAAGVKAAAGATAVFSAVSLALKGQLAAKIPLLGLVSTAMGIYRVQMALASAQGIILTGVLAKLRVALYAVQTALGPIGWVLLAISGLVAGGMALWNKYNQTFQKTPKVNTDVSDATGGATKAFEDQAKAMKQAGKAAGDNLQSFDEVHQLQEDMAGSGEDMLDVLDLETAGAGVPALDFEGMFASFDEAAIPFGEKVKGFFGWLWDGIKNGAVTAWDTIKGTLNKVWDDIVNLTKPIWEPIANFFSTLWSGIVNIAKIVWEPLAKFFSGLWEGIKSVAETIWNIIVFALAFVWFSIVEVAKTIFGPLMPYFSALWEGIRTVTTIVWNGLTAFLTSIWNSIVFAGRDVWSVLGPFITAIWESIRSATLAVWGFLSPYLTALWQGLLATVTAIWNALYIVTSIVWNTIRNLAVNIWNAIKEAVENPVEAARQAVETISENLKEKLTEIWENIKTNVAAITESIRSAAITTWENIKTAVVTRVNVAKDAVITAWNNAKNKLTEIWENIKTTAREKWDGVTAIIKGTINGIISMINKFIKAFNKIEIKVPSVDIPLFGAVGGWSIRVPQIPEIPMLAKGTNYVPEDMLAFLHEGEAVVPEKYNPASGDLADTIAQAVYRAIMDAIRISQASQPANDRDLVLKLDNTVLARMQLPAIIKEGQRQGLNLVVKPQGA